MKKTRLSVTLLLLLILGLPGSSRAMTAQQPPTLTVGILLHQKSVSVGGTRGFKVVDQANGRSLGVRWGHERATVQGWLAGLRYENRSSHHRLSVTPTAGGFVTVNGKPYRGTLDLQQDGQGGVNVVNVVDMESYLCGVVKAEMAASAPHEALKAQAIAARTFAFRGRNTFKSRGYGLKANEQSQVYGGVSMEDPRTTRAVSETRGVILTYEDEPIEALFHAACGGQTENNEDVWASPPMPYERAVPCPGCRHSPTGAWRAVFDYGYIAQRLRQYNWSVGDIYHITPSYTQTGRVKDLRIQSSRGTIRVPGNNFRIIVDRRAIRSLWWTGGSVDGGCAPGDSGIAARPDGPDDDQSMTEDGAAVASDRAGGQTDNAIRSIIGRYMRATPSGRVFSITGQGWGHGVGFCQWGAKVLAGAGRNYREILGWYYRGTRLARAY